MRTLEDVARDLAAHQLYLSGKIWTCIFLIRQPALLRRPIVLARSKKVVLNMDRYGNTVRRLHPLDDGSRGHGSGSDMVVMFELSARG